MGSTRPINVREEREKFHAKYGYVHLDELGRPKRSPQEILEIIIKDESSRQEPDSDRLVLHGKKRVKTARIGPETMPEDWTMNTEGECDGVKSE